MPSLKSIASGFCLLAVVFAVVLAAFLGVAVAVGYTLHLLVPSIELGTATLCGLVAIAILVFCFNQLGEKISELREIEEYDESEEDELMLSDEQVELVVEQLTEAIASRAWANSEELGSRTKHRQRR